ncbi:MAG: class I SAM-dependent methyltransferase [Chloroflexota bacterium]|nr:class I SAM-dependent methyltransferase [Chloroflexota bacterium]MDE2883752.1 class I SAM-dependent methyltransferase [Chloroflexota bacterium]
MTQRDDRALRRQIERYSVRFNEAFWRFWDEQVAPVLPPAPVIVDVGPGPGLFLRDLSARLPEATLHGVDANEAMVENARALDYGGPAPSIVLANVETSQLPYDDASVDLLTIAAVLHTFDDPFMFLREQASRVLKPGGHILLFDWFREPMRDYIARRLVEPGDPEELRYERALEQFRIHNKYTLDDWRWVLAESGMHIEAETGEPHPSARVWLLRPE